jgi:diguanylate cyclase (GGDEF)-like protein
MGEKKNSLLIVDDESSNLKFLSHILIDDYTVFSATNGLNAIEKAKEYKPDLILLDVLMPGLDGFQTLTEIKKTEEIKKIPIIFITGLDSAEDEEKGLSLDAADYIVKPFNPTVVKLRVRNQIQIINQMRTIECLSMIDQLTNLPNRRSFDDRLKMEWKHAVREREPISLMVFDLDRFKAINDNHGHQQGDIVLQTVASVFPKILKRPSDFVSRWGGEEFVVLMPNTALEGALDVAEKLRLEVENTPIPNINGSDIKMTVSIGVTSLLPTIDHSINTFFSKADKALYNAKETGRNRVCSI